MGLELQLEWGGLRFYSPDVEQVLLTHEEELAARHEAKESMGKLAAKLCELNILGDPGLV